MEVRPGEIIVEPAPKGGGAWKTALFYLGAFPKDPAKEDVQERLARFGYFFLDEEDLETVCAALEQWRESRWPLSKGFDLQERLQVALRERQQNQKAIPEVD